MSSYSGKRGICPMPHVWGDHANACQWKSDKSDPRSLRNTWTDGHVNLHGWLIREPLKPRDISSRYDYPLPPIMQKCASADSVRFFLVLLSAYSQDPCTDFYTQYIKWRLPFGDRKQNFTFWHNFFPKRKFILLVNWLTKILTTF